METEILRAFSRDNKYKIVVKNDSKENTIIGIFYDNEKNTKFRTEVKYSISDFEETLIDEVSKLIDGMGTNHDFYNDIDIKGKAYGGRFRFAMTETPVRGTLVIEDTQLGVDLMIGDADFATDTLEEMFDFINEQVYASEVYESE